MRQWLGGLGCLFLAAGTAMAQNFPARSLQVVVGFAAGGANDVAARMYSRELEQRIRQPVIVENRAGAAGILAGRLVAKAPADGYTLMFGGGTGSSTVFFKDGLDLFRDLAPVAVMVSGPWIMYASARIPARSFQELLPLAKSRPGGQLNFGASGSKAHLVMSAIKSRAGLDYVGVNYKGQTPTIQGLISGEIDISIDGGLAAYKSLVDAGKIRVLMVTRRTSLLPATPGPADAGVPGIESGFHSLFWVPVATPRDTQVKLNAELAAVAMLPQIRDKVINLIGGDPLALPLDETRRFAEDDLRFWSETARIAKYEPE